MVFRRKGLRMDDGSAVQAFSRGLAALRLLAENGPMTATGIGQALGVHQSSASRLLRSLQREGYVRKPTFHAFSLDMGILLLAGVAMEHFSEVGCAADVCSQLHKESGLGAASTMLLGDRLLYLARIGPQGSQRLSLLDDSDFPVHRSSPGMLLAYLRGRREMVRIMKASMRRYGAADRAASAERLWGVARGSVGRDGVLYLERFGSNRCSGSIAYETVHGRAALTLFSDRRGVGKRTVANLLQRGVARLREPAAQTKGSDR
jgi:DNA-binding IclR family transcriptional regulator